MRHQRLVRLLTVLALLAAGGVAQAQERAAARRAWLGISYRTTAEGAAGARTVIDDVHPDSPAERAGLQPGDVIVRWDGRTDVEQALRTPPVLEPGDTVRLRVRRGNDRDRDVVVVAAERPSRVVDVRREGRDRTIRVVPDAVEREIRVYADSLARRTVEVHRRVQEMLRDSLAPRLRELAREMPEIRIRTRDGADGEQETVELFDLGRRSVAGAELTEMNPELASYFGTDQGALVLRVAPETPAARAGLQPGDVVLRADGAAVSSAVDLRRALVATPDREPREIELEVLRKGKRQEMRLRWE